MLLPSAWAHYEQHLNCITEAMCHSNAVIDGSFFFCEQLWNSIVRHLSDSGVKMSSVLYVSPVIVSDNDAVSCMATAACDSAREVLTGVATGGVF